jgi:hypothetical protein
MDLSRLWRSIADPICRSLQPGRLHHKTDLAQASSLRAPAFMEASCKTSMVFILNSLAAKLKVGQGPPSESFSYLRCFGKIKGLSQGFAGGS